MVFFDLFLKSSWWAARGGACVPCKRVVKGNAQRILAVSANMQRSLRLRDCLAGRLAAAVCVLLISSLPVLAAGAGHTRATSELLDSIRDVHRQQENTGYVFIMSHHGKLVLQDHDGMAVIEHDIPIEMDSVFPIMSITKAFTGTALAIAESEELVDLDVPIRQYLPDYEGEGAAEITLRMLAAHLSGIAHTGHPERKALYVEHFASAADAISVFSGKPLISPPGTKYNYSSSGYNLIAAVIERVAEMPWRQYVRSRVIDPLGLESTGFDDVMKPMRGKVRNYSYVDIWSYAKAESLQLVPTWDFSYNDGGGNMVSSAEDLLTFGEAVLGSGALSERVLKRLRERAAADPALSSWTLGWIDGKDPQGRRTIHITGATPGVQAALYVYPDEALVFAMLANCWGKGSAGGDLVVGAPQRLVDAYLSGPPQD